MHACMHAYTHACTQVQALLGLFLLFYLVGIASHEMRDVENLWTWQPEGGYMAGGSTALLAALLQGFLSYPFHDPVRTSASHDMHMHPSHGHTYSMH